MLSKIAYFNSLTHSHATTSGSTTTGNNIHQGGLACAIGSHNAHTVVTQQNIAKILQIIDTIIFHRNMVQLDNSFAQTTANGGHL